MGIYHRPVHVDGGKRPQRIFLYDRVKEVLTTDLHCYTKIDKTDFEKLMETHMGFGFWNQTYISTYTDYTTSVCNIMFETITSLHHAFKNAEHMYNREYITEKTLQALLYSKENIFFIWYGPQRMLNILKNLGFWFLNFEFYDESINVNSTDDGTLIGPVENSMFKTVTYIKELKENLKDNKTVYEYLLSRYGKNLEKNGVLLDKILKTSMHREKILELVRK